MKRITKRKICIVLFMAMLMMIQTALIPMTVISAPSSIGLTIEMTPTVTSAEPGNRISVLVDLIPLREDIGYPNHPGMVTVLLDILFDASRLEFADWNFLENCPAEAAGFSAIISLLEPQATPTPAGMRAIRVFRSNVHTQPITFNAPIMMHFYVREDAPNGEALIRWSTENRIVGGAGFPVVGVDTAIYFNEPTSASFARVNITSGTTPPNRNVTFNLQGGTGSFPAQSVVHGVTVARPTVEPTRAGYSFNGWWTAVTGGTRFDFATPILVDTVIYARWISDTAHTVTFNLHGGTADFELEIPVHDGERVMRPTVEPTRTGYSFDGWWTTVTNGAMFNFNSPIMADTTIHARWRPNHTVTFSLHGGTSTFPTTQFVADRGMVPHPSPHPTRAGYSFNGWWTAATDGTEFDFNRMIMADTTIHAHWVSFDGGTHTVTFNLNGGTGNFSTTQTVANGGLVTRPPHPRRTGYAFGGWWTEETGGTEFNFNNTAVTDDITLYAYWVAPLDNVNERTVSFNLHGGRGTFPQTLRIEHGSTVTRPAVDPTRAGYTFAGWWTEETGGTEFNFNMSITVNRVIHARWTAVEGAANNAMTLTISNFPTITPNGQSPIAGSHTVNAGASMTLASGNTDNWTFLGWFRAANRPASGSTVAVPTSRNHQLTMPNSNTHYVAVWGNQDGVVGIPNTPEEVAEERTSHHAFLIGFEDGTVRPTGTATRAHLATVLFRLMSDADRTAYWSQTNSFADVALENWFNNAISTTMNAGVFSPAMPMPGGNFEPERQVTRAEVMAAIVRLQGVSPITTAKFNDISGHWAAGYINAAAEEGWTFGFTGIGGEFRPDDLVTRAQMAALINRAFGRLPQEPSDLLSDMVRWSDNANPNAWYYLYMQEATNSHYYVMKANGINETWTHLIPPRNWAVLERPTSRPGDILR